MGGSGALGDVFNSIMSNTNIHVSVIKGYKLPKTVDVNTLVISSSVSGNTIETLSILKQVKKTMAKSISFSSNGKMEEYCLKNNLEHRYVEQNHSPRASFSSFLYTMLKVMKPMLPIKNKEIMESIKKLEHTQKENAKNLIKNIDPKLQLTNNINLLKLIH